MKRRLLLVDDEPSILLTMKAILEMNDFLVETARSASEAKSKLENGKFHIVITDMNMESETAGFDVVRAARKQQYAPVIAILTGYPALTSEWEKEGAHAVLVKPMDHDDLLRQIEALLRQDEARKSSAK